MSVNIHNGFEINATSLANAEALIQDFAINVAPKAIEAAQAKFLIEYAANQYDLVSLKREPAPARRSYIQLAMQELIRCQNDTPSNVRHEDDTDFAMKVVLFESSGNFYGIYYTDCPGLWEAFMTREYIGDYSWHSGTEPECLRENEWRRRESTWRAILQDFAVAPEKAGKVIAVSTVSGRKPNDDGPISMPSMETLQRQMPAIEWRANQVAMISLLDSLYENGKHKVTGIEMNTVDVMKLRMDPQFKLHEALIKSELDQSIDLQDLITVPAPSKVEVPEEDRAVLSRTRLTH